MALSLVTIPCLSDNYAFLIGNPATKEAALIDVPEAAPINAALEKSGWRLTTVILTHHHDDHVQGLNDLVDRDRLHVIGARADAHRLPALDQDVNDGDTLTLLGEAAHIMDVSGHTVGHIAIHLPESGLVFTADSLMAMGCGRLFEGTPAQMWDSLQKLRALPPETLVCSGHEYTATNGRFAASLEAANPSVTSRIDAIKKARATNTPTVPSTLALELATNPFLRGDDPVLQTAIGMAGQDPVAVFTEIRARKDRFS